MIATMREEEKYKVDRMARDLEIKWTENLRQVLFYILKKNIIVQWYKLDQNYGFNHFFLCVIKVQSMCEFSLIFSGRNVVNFVKSWDFSMKKIKNQQWLNSCN